jgi:ribosomal protein L17
MAYYNLYIVDNDASQQSVKKYLDERQVIYRQVAASYFEICGLLRLDEKWKKFEKIRITLSSEVTKLIRKTIVETENYFRKDMDKNTKGKRDKYGFFLSLLSTFAILNKIVRQIFDKLSFRFLKPEGAYKRLLRKGWYE